MIECFEDFPISNIPYIHEKRHTWKRFGSLMGSSHSEHLFNRIKDELHLPETRNGMLDHLSGAQLLSSQALLHLPCTAPLHTII